MKIQLTKMFEMTFQISILPFIPNVNFESENWIYRKNPLAMTSVGNYFDGSSSQKVGKSALCFKLFKKVHLEN